MANLIIVVDPDVDRRWQFMHAVEPRLSPIEGLVVDKCSVADCAMLWAAAPSAPISKESDEDGIGVIWGDAIRSETAERQVAGRLRKAWLGDPGDAFETYDGFYAAAVYSIDQGLIVGADLLGYYPVYYFGAQDVLLVGSSPELFRYHPLFRPALNPEGVVGLLLTNGLVDGQTLWQGVKRLSAGHVLCWKNGGSTFEVEQYRIPASDRHFGAPFSAHVDILDHVLEKAIARHAVVNRSYALLLSGGMDSRLLGGYLGEHRVQVKALTFGAATDIEMRCARRVAHALGFEHHGWTLPDEVLAQHADLSIRWEHLAGGFNGLYRWNNHIILKKLAPSVITAHSIDAAVGTGWLHPTYCAETRSISYEKHFARVNAWGISPDVLKSLLRPDVFGDLVDQVLERIKEIFDQGADCDFQRVWVFNLGHRQRFHVGSAGWNLALAAWPVLPVLDRQVLEAAGGMPAATIAERRGETCLLGQRFPTLAQLPLDRGGPIAVPLEPRIRQRLLLYARNRLDPSLKLLRRILGRSEIERRYVRRITDFSGPGWMAVRRRVEPYRQRAYALFEREELDRFLPAPGGAVMYENRVTGPSAHKLLLGILLFCRDHLP